MNSTNEEDTVLKVSTRLYEAPRQRLLALAKKLNKPFNGIANGLLIAGLTPPNDPEAILAGATVVPPAIPPEVEVDPTQDGPTKEALQLLFDKLEKAIVQAVSQLAEKPTSEPVDLNPLLNKMAEIENKITGNLAPVLAEIKSVSTDFQPVLTGLKTIKEQLVSLPAPTVNLDPVNEAVAKIQAEVGKLDLPRIAAGPDVINKHFTPEARANAVALKTSVDDFGKANRELTTAVETCITEEKQERNAALKKVCEQAEATAKKAREEIEARAEENKALTAALTAVAKKPAVLKPEHVQLLEAALSKRRRIWMPLAIGVCLLLSATGAIFSGIAAFRPAPAKVDLTPLQADIGAVRQLIESRPDLAPKVADLASRVDVQDKAFVAVMDQVDVLKKKSARPKETP